MKRLLPYLGIALLGGVAAVLLPALVAAGPGPSSVWQRAVQLPSIWSFHGLFVCGFFLALFGALELMDLPLVSVAMVGPFPAFAGLRMLTGRGVVAWPREFYLYGAWLVPALGGLLVGWTIRTLQNRARESRDPGRGRQRGRKRR